jgi:hypothetical protein
MAARFSTVRLNSELIDAARGEADLLHRSLGGQIEHWARLGRAIEEAGLPLARVRQALEGSLRVEALSRIEQDQVFALLGERLRNPAAPVRAGYAALGEVVGAAGDDTAGRLVTRDRDGALHPVQ